MGGSYWYIHQPAEWQAAQRKRLGPPLADAIERTGYGVADFTDDLGISGRDVRVSMAANPEASRSVHYAGPPRNQETGRVAGELLVSSGFEVGYCDTRRNPLWAAYRVSRVDDLVEPPRPSQFTTDTRTRARVVPTDYKGSGYDRGHMAPNFAIATRYGKVAQQETFRMSNISPQRPDLNQYCWRDLEHRIASRYGQAEDDVWVVVGPVFDRETPGALASGVQIPDAFFMITIDEIGSELRAFAVIIPQDVRRWQSPTPFLASIDEVEARTGLDLLSELPDEVEQALERDAATRLWPSLIPCLKDRVRAWFPRDKQ